MSISSELALETAARTFGDSGNLITLENGVLFVALLNVVANSLLLVTFLVIAVEGSFGKVTFGELGCTYLRGECLNVSTPEEAMFVGGLGAVVSVPIIYLHARLYSAVQEKDEEYVYLWLKISSGLTLLSAFTSPHLGHIVPNIFQLWLVHAYQQSEEIKKWSIKLPIPYLLPS